MAIDIESRYLPLLLFPIHNAKSQDCSHKKRGYNLKYYYHKAWNHEAMHYFIFLSKVSFTWNEMQGKKKKKKKKKKSEKHIHAVRLQWPKFLIIAKTTPALVMHGACTSGLSLPCFELADTNMTNLTVKRCNPNLNLHN